MNWSVDDLPWQDLDRSKVTPEMVSLAKAACMVEHNGYDYGRYLREVFPDDEAFKKAIDTWEVEEVKHGEALRKWAETVDPAFDFEKSFRMFTEGYKLPLNVDGSVRGSRSGELVARCIVEVGTSSYYTALANATQEPVFKALCLKIAADEFRHYKLFYTHLKEYLEREKLGAFKRFRIALGRVTESEDDELSYAYYAAHYTGEPYDRETFIRIYQKKALAVYKRENVERMMAMIWKVIGIKPYDRVQRLSTDIAWGLLKFKRARLASIPVR